MTEHDNDNLLPTIANAIASWIINRQDTPVTWEQIRNGIEWQEIADCIIGSPDRPTPDCAHLDMLTDMVSWRLKEKNMYKTGASEYLRRKENEV